MGQSSSNIKKKLEGKPIVVIIGGGYGGCALATALDKDFNVLVLERKSYRFHNIAALRAAVNPEYVSKVIIPYTNMLSNGYVLHCEVEGIEKNGVKIVGRDELIPYNFLIFATGSSYCFPAKIAAATADEAVASFKSCHQALANAKNISIIGGGPVGLELMGEISDYYKGSKSVTLIHAHNWLAQEDLAPKFQTEVKSRVGTLKNTKVILNEKVILDEEMVKEYSNGNGRFLAGERVIKTDKGTEIKTDLIFYCGGSKVNSSCYSSIIPASVDPDTQRLKVNDHLQVENLPAQFAGAYIFAIGDCANVKESKLAFYAGNQAAHLANTIRRINEKVAPYKTGGNALFLPLGTDQGLAQFPNEMVVGKTITQMIKGDLFVAQNWKQMRLKPESQVANTKTQITDDDIEHIRKMNADTLSISAEDARKLLEGFTIKDHLGEDHT